MHYLNFKGRQVGNRSNTQLNQVACEKWISSLRSRALFSTCPGLHVSLSIMPRSQTGSSPETVPEAPREGRLQEDAGSCAVASGQFSNVKCGFLIDVQRRNSSISGQLPI